MSKTMVAAVTAGIFILLVAGLATSRCRRGGRPAEVVVVVDTATSDSGKSKVHKPRSKKRHKKRETSLPTQPSSRNYLDETVSSDDSAE